MIKPTVGRVVLYFPAPDEVIPYTVGQPLAAIIAAVHSDDCVNLAVFDENGGNHGRSSVILQVEPINVTVARWEWMPYQLGQAARTEAAEAKVPSTAIERVAPKRREKKTGSKKKK